MRILRRTWQNNAPAGKQETKRQSGKKGFYPVISECKNGKSGPSFMGKGRFFCKKKIVKKAKILAQRPAALYTKIEKKREGGGFLSVAERRNHDANVSRLWPHSGG